MRLLKATHLPPATSAVRPGSSEQMKSRRSSSAEQSARVVRVPENSTTSFGGGISWIRSQAAVLQHDPAHGSPPTKAAASRHPSLVSCLWGALREATISCTLGFPQTSRNRNFGLLFAARCRAARPLS